MPNQIPEKLKSFRMYLDGVDLLGIADIELPSMEWMGDDVSGAGIAGKYKSPTVGHFDSLTIKCKWRVLTKNQVKLMAHKAHHLDCRGSAQRYDAGAGEYADYPIKLVVKGLSIKQGLGKMETAKQQDNESEFECLYLKLWLEGQEAIEIDKLNYIYKVNGTDYLAETRSHLGLEG